VTGGLRKLVPNVNPSGPVLIDPLSTDLELDVLEESVTDPVDPSETVMSSAWNGHGD
jgi:hypothetical protein